MDLPYRLTDEVEAIHRERLRRNDLVLSDEEGRLTLEHRGWQFGTILGKRIAACGIDAQQITKVVRMLSGEIEDDGSFSDQEQALVEAMINARAEFRVLLGLPPSSDQHGKA